MLLFRVRLPRLSGKRWTAEIGPSWHLTETAPPCMSRRMPSSVMSLVRTSSTWNSKEITKALQCPFTLPARFAGQPCLPRKRARRALSTTRRMIQQMTAGHAGSSGDIVLKPPWLPLVRSQKRNSGTVPYLLRTRSWSGTETELGRGLRYATCGRRTRASATALVSRTAPHARRAHNSY